MSSRCVRVGQAGVWMYVCMYVCVPSSCVNVPTQPTAFLSHNPHVYLTQTSRHVQLHALGPWLLGTYENDARLCYPLLPSRRISSREAECTYEGPSELADQFFLLRPMA